MTKLSALSVRAIAILNESMCAEQRARYFYEAAANWCRNKGYAGGEKFFTAEAASEGGHYSIISNFLADWNVLPLYEAVTEPVDFDSLDEIISLAYELELSLYHKYNGNSLAIFTEDQTTYDFLQQFRKIQAESVAEYATLLNKLSLIDVSNSFQLMWFDHEILNNE